jgi:hypothetical protein
MADDIKIIVNKVDSDGVLQQEDLSLINSFQINSTFNSISDRIQLHIYSIDGIYLETYEDYVQYRIERQGSISPEESSTLLIELEEDLLTFGYSNGDVKFEYRFLRDLFSTDKNQPGTFFIENISPDRTEIRALSLQIADSKVVDVSTELSNRFNELPYVDTIKINFGQNNIFQIVNVKNQIEIEGNTYLLLKLYEPLSDQFDIKTRFTVEEEVSDTLSFEFFTEFPVQVETFPQLKGPNFNIEYLSEISNPSEFLSQQDILLSLTGSNYQALSLLNRTGAQISIDHTDYSNFVHFSSATERLQNFKFKLEKIQQYENETELFENGDPAISTGSIALYDNLILGVVQNFSTYERFLYFESGSLSWPKISNDYPYVNQPINTTEAISWFEDQLEEATFYDTNNPHRLINSIPTYITEDEANTPYNLFVDMIGEFFDNLWIYARAVTDRYDGDNRLNFGISRDLVAEALRGFGIKLYGSDTTFQNLFAIFTGQNYPTGSEQINNFITGSELPTPIDDYQKQVYKRLYHNIPILLKSKGTERGLRALINTFGIPKDTLTFRIYGGSNSDTLPYFGLENSYTSSLGKIRLDNTGSIAPGDTLSYLTPVVRTEEKYTQDLHKLEVGFSPSNNINNYLLSGPLITGSFDIDDYVGDPRLLYTSQYEQLRKVTKEIFSGSINTRYNLYDFVRLLKFYDNTLFKMIKDFVPGRTVTSTGIIIKPHILERSKVKQVQAKWSIQDKLNSTGQSSLDYSNSDVEYEKNFAFFGTVDMVRISGKSGGAFSSGSTTGSYGTFSFEEEYDTRYSYEVLLPEGGSGSLSTFDESKYNGEFGEIISNIDGVVKYKPQAILATDGELNRDNVFKKTNLQPYFFSVRALRRQDPFFPTLDCSLEGFISCGCNLAGQITCN